MNQDPLGVNAGSLGELGTSNLSNEYSNIADTPVDAQADRVQPRQIPSGVTRGIQQLGSEKVYSDGGNSQIIVEDATTPRVLMGNQSSFGEGFYVSKSGINAKTNTDAAQWIFNSNQNVFKIVANPTVTIAALTRSAGSSSSTSATIDLTAYAATAVILPIARVSGQPSFVWQGMRGLSSTVVTGTAGWQVVADYSTTWSAAGVMQLTRTLINASAGSYTDDAYTVTLYILQETAA